MHNSSGAAGSSGHERPDRRPATIEIPLPKKPSPPEPGPQDEPEPAVTAEQETEQETGDQPGTTAEQDTVEQDTAEQDTVEQDPPADESGPAEDLGTSGPDETRDGLGAAERHTAAEQHRAPWYRTADQHDTTEPYETTDETTGEHETADRHDAEEKYRGAAETRLDLPLPARTPVSSPASEPEPAATSPTAPQVSPSPLDLLMRPGPQSPPPASEPLRSPSPQVSAAPYDPPTPRVPSALGPVSPQPASGPGSKQHAWHPFHSLIGVFLVTYGVTGMLGTIAGMADHQREIADYLAKTVGAGAVPATALLMAVKAVELLLTVTALTGVLRRTDVWLLPALFGWMAGFGVFCVLDLSAGFMRGLAEHVLFLLVFTALLRASYVLSRKARARRPAPPAGPYGPHAPGDLIRT